MIKLDLTPPPKSPKPVKATVTAVVKPELLLRIDAAAKAAGLSRSEFAARILAMGTPIACAQLGLDAG